MTLEQQQFVQCFQLSIDDLKVIIKDAVKSVILPPPNNSKLTLAASNSNPEDELLTTKEVGKILKVSSTTLWRYNKNGILKIKNKIGRKVFYSKRDVFNLINATSK